MKNLIKLLLVSLLVISSAVYSKPVQAKQEVNLYVSNTGVDTNDGLSTDSALATLAKASEIVNADTEGNTYIINVLSDLTMTKAARFYNHDVVICSENGYVVTRGETFETLSDVARSWYNPAMIEIQANTTESSLTLRNIVFDDNYRHMGTVFSQQLTDGSSDNTQYVQDGIISSNATVKCVITLDKDAVLRNFGGMSAIRATDKAQVVMLKGSKIEDTGSTVRSKSGKETGAAGAIWIQGAIMDMMADSSIYNINGRAIYVDGGYVQLEGTIRSVTSNTKMWQSNSGYVLHLRNGAQAILEKTFTYDGKDISCKGSAFVVNPKSELTAAYRSVIKNFSNSMAIQVVDDGKLFFDGEITNVKAAGANTNVVNIQNGNLTDSGYRVVFGPNSNVHHNTGWYGVFYIQAKAGEVHLYGKINDNYSSDRGGAVTLAHNLGFTSVYMYDGAEMINNYSKKTGGAVMVSRGRFIMNGGTISNNIANSTGGAIYVRNSGQFIMNGGTISSNATADIGGGIAYEASMWDPQMPLVQLNGGTISDNYMKATITAAEDSQYTFDKETAISNDVAVSAAGSFATKERSLQVNSSEILANQNIYFAVDNKYVKATDLCSDDVMLGNANSTAVSALKQYATDSNWTSYITSLYASSSEKLSLDVSGLTLAPYIPVYAVVSEGVDLSGNGSSTIEVYPTTVSDGVIHVDLPQRGSNSLGNEIILVQPTYNVGTLNISTVDKLYKDDSVTSYSIPYTVKYTASTDALDLFKESTDTLTKDSVTFEFVVTLDSRLTAEYLAVDSKFVTVDSYDVSGNVATVKCKLADDWQTQITDLENNGIVVKVNGTLASADFVVSEILKATSSVKMQLTDADQLVSFNVPSNTCETELCDSIGDLKVTKVVKGNDDDQSVYEIVIELSDTTVNGTYGDVTFTDGVTKVQLSNGQSVTAVGLKSGLKFTVSETVKQDDKFKVTYTNQTGEIVNGELVEVSVINTYSVTPETGDYTNISMISLVMISSMVLMSTIVFLKKKYN